MRSRVYVFITALLLSLIIPLQGKSQLAILEIIKAGVKKVIVAVDLKVQRLQNKTIWLQQAQKSMENTMSKLHLNDVNEWAQKQKALYANYFDELRQVRETIRSWQRVKDIVNTQVQIVQEYKRAWMLVKEDRHFSPEELRYISSVYNGMLTNAMQLLDQLHMVIRPLTTSMSDADRMKLVAEVEQNAGQVLSDLRRFTSDNRLLSIQRSTDKTDLDYVKRLYGINN